MMRFALGRKFADLIHLSNFGSFGRHPSEAVTAPRQKKKTLPKPDLEAFRNRFEALRQNGQIATVHQLAQRALQTWPDETFFQIQIGHCLVSEEKWEEADQHWQKIREANPALHTAYLCGATANLFMGKHTEAASLLDALIALGNLPDEAKNDLQIKARMICREDIRPTQTHLRAYVEANDPFRQTFPVQDLSPANKLIEKYAGDQAHLHRLKSMTPGQFASILMPLAEVTIFPHSFETSISPQRVMEHVAYSSDGKPISCADHHKRVYTAFVDHCDKDKVGSPDLYTEERPVVYCGNFIPHHGHFIVETLPRLWALLKQPQFLSEHKIYFNTFSGVNERWKHPPNIYKHHYGDYLTALGISPEQLAFVEKPTVFKNIVVSSPATSICSADCFASKEATMVWRTANQRMSDQWRESSGDRQPPRKIYISRGRVELSVGGRALENEASLEQLLRSMGYEVVFPEELVCEMQKQFLLSNPEIVVGPSGSGLLNTVFSPPGAKIVCVDSDKTMKMTHTVPQQVAFDKFCDHRSFVYIQKTEKESGDAKWRLDIDRFKRFLQDVESAP